MDKCSSPGDSLNNWTSGCEHLGSKNPSASVTTVRVGGSNTYTSQTPVSYTSRGLGTPTADDEQIFGPGGTLGGPSYSTSSGGINPSTGYAEGDAKLNSWAPDPSSSSTTLRPVEGSDFVAGSASPSAELQGTSALSQSSTPTSPSTPPSVPSTKPYIWKYQ